MLLISICGFMYAHHLSHDARKPVFGVSDHVRHKPAYSPTEKARIFKFWVYVEQVLILYVLYSENKGADQLRSYCEADLRLCFRIGKNPVFTCHGSFLSKVQFSRNV